MKFQNLIYSLFNNRPIHWKGHLAQLEYNKQWDEAIEFMREVITQYPNNLDAYLSINFLIMNLLVEEQHDCSKHDYYTTTLKNYFDESYEKFSENPEYLYYIGRIAVMSPWYFGIESEDIEEMLQRALSLDPENPIYQWIYYRDLDKHDPKNKELIIAYAKMIISQDSPIKKTLHSKGTLGEYILDIMQGVAQRILYPENDVLSYFYNESES